MSREYRRGEDEVLDALMDEWHLPPTAEAADKVRATLGYKRRRLAVDACGLESDSFDEIRRRLHSEDN